MVNDQVKSQVRSLVKEILEEMKNEDTKAKHTPPRKNILRHLLEEGSEPSESSISESDVLPKINCYIDTSQDNKLNVINFRLNQDLHETVRQGAEQRGLSEASFIRESLMFRSNRASPDKNREIDKLIQSCIEIKEGSRTFMFDGPQGFLAQAVERELIGEVWSPENLDKIVPYLKNTSYKEQCIQALKLVRLQIQYLSISLMATIDETQKENEYFFMPFAFCGKCYKPLTKKDFLEGSTCPHCHNRQGQVIFYDMANQDAFYKPFSVCSQCFKPMTEQQSHLWKNCPYCGTTEPDIHINYEGIKTEPANPKPKPKTLKETEKDEEEQEKPAREETEPQNKLDKALNKIVESAKKNGG